MEDWNSSKVTLTIKRGTAPGETAARLFPKARVRQFDDDAQALQDVLNGNAHAFLTSEPKPAYYVIDNPKSSTIHLVLVLLILLLPRLRFARVILMP